ncbi:hypothetical protein ABTM96_19715, partial [Acinetobacter baumannii]
MRSDVRGPLQQGVSAVWLAPWKPEARPSGDFSSVLTRFLEGKCAGKSAGYQIGYEILGPIMLLFGAYVLDQAIAEGTQTIWFL